MIGVAQAAVATRTYLVGTTLVLPDETVPDGSVLIEDGVIAAICPESVRDVQETVNLESDILMPGLIDIHTDAIEKEMDPRQGARLPLGHAVIQGDRKCALAGITTPFHALSF